MRIFAASGRVGQLQHDTALSTGASVARGVRAVSISLTVAAIGLLVFFAGSATAAGGAYLGSFGPDGTSGSVFERPAAVGVDPGTGAVYVADSTTQTLYKFDASGAPSNWGGSEGYISENRITGLSMDGSEPFRVQVSVDPSNHVIYLTSGNKVRAFESNGEPHEFTALGGGISELSGAAELSGVAVDGSGNIYTSDRTEEEVRIYKQSGELITSFEPKSTKNDPVVPGSLAIASDGTLYVTDLPGTREVYVFEPSEVPVSSKTTYGLGAPLNEPTSPSTAVETFSVAVDPSTQYVYTGERCHDAECEFAHQAASRVSVYDEAGDLVERIGVAEPGALRGSAVGVGINGGAKRLYVAVLGEDGGSSQVSVYETLQFTSGPPSIFGFGISDVTSTSAVFSARINPNTFDTTYWFEYGTADCSSSINTCTSVPVAGEAIGAGHDPVPVSADLAGLTPGTTYYYRVVAENSKGVTKGPVRTFISQGTGFGFAAMDGRVWEQVTPLDKFGGIVGNKGGVVQAAADGSGITFPTRGSLLDSPSGSRSPELATSLARRQADGWQVSDLTPPRTEANGAALYPEYKGFSADLYLSVLEPRDNTLLSPEASERTPYLREDAQQPPVFRPLVTGKEGFSNVEQGTAFGGGGADASFITVEGVNEDLSSIVVSSKVPLRPGAQERALYVWNGGSLKPVSVPADPNGVAVVRASLGSGMTSTHHAVSSDGSRIFWSSPRSQSGGFLGLFVRDTEAEESSRLDEVHGGSGEGAENPLFVGANREGTVVFFTDSQQLTADANPAGRDLYRCEVGEVGETLGCVVLEDLTASLNGAGEAVRVREVAPGMSEDGRTIYFVENAEKDKPKLYVWREGTGVRLIAQLSMEDHPDWGATTTSNADQASLLGANSSPNGRYLGFMSERSLTGTETSQPESGEPVEQAYRYDADTETLVCISCNPSGATDEGQRLSGASEGSGIFPDSRDVWGGRLMGATLPGPTELEPTIGPSFYQPRSVLDNGRMFFNSPSALVPADSNGTWDVYQYEPFGVGNCAGSSAGPSIAVAGDACVGLISAGTGDRLSVLLDTSENGNDAFIGTFDRLSVLDSDEVADVYDARVGGVAAVAEKHPECLGEACQPPPSPPNDATPASAAFSGPGNPKPKAVKHCRHGQRKVRRKGKTRCIGRRHHGSRHAKRGAGR